MRCMCYMRSDTGDRCGWDCMKYSVSMRREMSLEMRRRLVLSLVGRDYSSETIAVLCSNERACKQRISLHHFGPHQLEKLGSRLVLKLDAIADQPVSIMRNVEADKLLSPLAPSARLQSSLECPNSPTVLQVVMHVVFVGFLISSGVEKEAANFVSGVDRGCVGRA